MFILYMHTNPLNLKSYVGYTKHSLDKRFQNHRAYARRGSILLFHKALRKYGDDCWASQVLDKCETLAEARELEKKFIAKYRTSERGLGYNMTEGGEGSNCKGKVLTLEHRLKVIAGLRKHVWTAEEYKSRGLKLRGLKRTPEARLRISRGMISAKKKGLTEAQWRQLKTLHIRAKGTKRTKETRDKISFALKGKPKTEQHCLALRTPKKSRGFKINHVHDS